MHSCRQLCGPCHQKLLRWDGHPACRWLCGADRQASRCELHSWLLHFVGCVCTGGPTLQPYSPGCCWSAGSKQQASRWPHSCCCILSALLRQGFTADLVICCCVICGTGAKHSAVANLMDCQLTIPLTACLTLLPLAAESLKNVSPKGSNPCCSYQAANPMPKAIQPLACMVAMLSLVPAG